MRRRFRHSTMVMTGAAIAGLLTATVAPTGASAAVYTRVVTFGDSYSAGVGIWQYASSYDDQGPAGHNFGNTQCWREDDTTPGPVVAASMGASVVHQACSGAEIYHVVNQLNATSFSSGGAGNLIALTAGGNDLRTAGGKSWPKLLESCILWESSCHAATSNQITNLATIRANLTSLYTQVVNKAPSAAVRVWGYPRIMQPDSFWGCLGVTGISTAEGRWMDTQVDRLNTEIAGAINAVRAATGRNIQFVNVISQFSNHGACRTWAADRYINDRVGPLWDVSDSSFHPNQNGYNAFRSALQATV